MSVTLLFRATASLHHTAAVLATWNALTTASAFAMLLGLPLVYDACRLQRSCPAGMRITWAAYVTGCSRAELITSPVPSAERLCLSRNHPSAVTAPSPCSICIILIDISHCAKYNERGMLGIVCMNILFCNTLC